MRILFFGTPEFAVPTLEALHAAHEVVLVVAQPDRPAGRGMRLTKPAVAVRAAEFGLTLLQPEKIRSHDFLQRVAAAQAEAGVVVAFGRILPPALLQIPAHGFLNVHGSLLPKYRGAAPMQRAIEAGETESGVTIMRVDEELDHGPILRAAVLPIGPDDRLPVVSARLAQLGAREMLLALDDLHHGRAVEHEQRHELATFAAKIEKSEGLITFEESAANIYNRFRAFDPWPGIFFESGGEVVRIREMQRAGGAFAPAPRQILAIDDRLRVGTGDGAIELERMQRPGKQPADAVTVARALGWRAGERIP